MAGEYATKIAKVKNAMDNRYENKQTNKKTNISGDFSEDTASYPTVQAVKTYVEGKGYLTEHQSIEGKVDIAQGNAAASKNVVTDGSGNITTEDKPVIPTKVSDLTNDSGFLVSNDISGKVDVAQGAGNKNKNVVTDASGNITIADMPSIPSKTSDLTNDSGFLTQHQSLDSKLSISQTSYKGKNVVVDNTTGDITFEDKPVIPTNVSDLTNDAGYLTQHQSLTNYVQKSDTVGLIKNDGSIDTNTYLTTHQSLSDIGGVVDVVEKSSANEGAFKTYQITQNSVSVGEIDIPKDFLVKSGSVKTAGSTPTEEEEDAGVSAGEKYISLIINTKDSTSSGGTELIIPASGLVEDTTYSADNSTLQLSNANVFSIKTSGVDTTQIKDAAVTSDKIASSVKNSWLTTSDVDTEADSRINAALDALAEAISPTPANQE